MPQPVYEQPLPVEGSTAGMPHRSNPIVAEYLDIVLKEAQRLASKDSNLTVEDMFMAAGFYSPSDIPQAKRVKVSAWNLAMKYEASFVPEDIATEPIVGVGKDGRPGFSTGQYPKWLSARLKEEPELRERYQKKADRMNSIHDSGDDDEMPVGMGPLDLKRQQKKTLKEIQKLVCTTSTSLFELVQAHTS